MLKVKKQILLWHFLNRSQKAAPAATEPVAEKPAE
jgi:hypothetical protein